MNTNSVNSRESFEVRHTELIEGCREGNQKAQFMIYKLYYKAMYNVSLKIVKDPMEAEDIMQESFLTAFEQICSFSGKVSFGAWLRKIVQNKSIDYLRRNDRIAFEDLEPATEIAVPEEHENPEEHEKIMVFVYQSLKHLSKSCRKVFSLHYLEGYDYDEISEILSVSTSTSRSQVSRARKRLLNVLNENEKFRSVYNFKNQ